MAHYGAVEDGGRLRPPLAPRWHLTPGDGDGGGPLVVARATRSARSPGRGGVGLRLRPVHRRDRAGVHVGLQDRLATPTPGVPLRHRRRHQRPGGPGPPIQTVAGFTVWKSFLVLVVVGAVWGLLTATRLLRGEEEAGRTELLLAGQTTRPRATAQTLLGLGVGLAFLWAVTAAIVAAAGRDATIGFSPAAAAYFALAVVAGAAVFLAVGAFTSQVAATRRQAAGYAAGVLGRVLRPADGGRLGRRALLAGLVHAAGVDRGAAPPHRAPAGGPGAHRGPGRRAGRAVRPPVGPPGPGGQPGGRPLECPGPHRPAGPAGGAGRAPDPGGGRRLGGGRGGPLPAPRAHRQAGRAGAVRLGQPGPDPGPPGHPRRHRRRVHRHRLPHGGGPGGLRRRRPGHRPAGRGGLGAPRRPAHPSGVASGLVRRPAGRGRRPGGGAGRAGRPVGRRRGGQPGRGGRLHGQSSTAG